MRRVTPTALKGLRLKLLELKAELLREGDIEIEPGRIDAAAVGTDEDAQPLTEMSQTIASSRNRSRAGVMRLVTAALARLDATPDTFGLCTACEEPISTKRLQLLPYVELCVACQTERDPTRGLRRASITDYK
jgi:DnaK suppressor protein